MRGDQLARQWQLVQRLARSRSGVGLDELSDDLGCVRRTIYRDLDALMYAGFPVVSEKRAGKVFYRFLDTFQLGDVPFTADEILALAFSEDLLRSLEGTVFHDSIQSALTKIRSALSRELMQFLDTIGGTFRVLAGPHKRYADSRETIQALNQAVLARSSVRIRYFTGRTGEESERTLDPYQVWYREGGLYVIGFDHRSQEIRTFAVDRIRALQETGDSFEVLEGFDFDRWTAANFGVVSEPAARVRIRFEAAWAHYIRERVWHRSQSLTPRPDGGLELTMEVGGDQELANWILSFGPGAEVLEPPGLRNRVSEALREALKPYGPAAKGQKPTKEGN
ncbi:MAG: helix-turn-helix transcriptional regulator [Myxococcota bacterium]